MALGSTKNYYQKETKERLSYHQYQVKPIPKVNKYKNKKVS